MVEDYKGSHKKSASFYNLQILGDDASRIIGEDAVEVIFVVFFENIPSLIDFFEIADMVDVGTEGKDEVVSNHLNQGFSGLFAVLVNNTTEVTLEQDTDGV